MKKESGYMHGGFKSKYNIVKTNGSPIDEEAIYFILRIDNDEHALSSFKRYAVSVYEDNIELSNELQVIWRCVKMGLVKSQIFNILENWRSNPVGEASLYPIFFLSEKIKKNKS